ncbi:hypothetical protein [Salipiger aestuarii]|uniref:hypothetical protein n=1 Tax=Salipiger aestuarii TaxID=568098 RepID=UPI001239608E|nr:hypothetical protein [Salipiger aestuarii]KAA8616274.1 hypothetical protein AL037_01605 [Salipiger aestuarii]
MTRVVVHAGFHKTGTSTVQHALAQNRDALAPHLRIHLREDFDPLTASARSWSVTRSDKHFAAIGRNALRFFRSIGREDTRPVLMSSEDLCGHMPGRNGIAAYDAAPDILRVIADNARHWFGPALDLVIYFSTRAPDPWLRSTWWQNLRSTRLTKDLDPYADDLPRAADLSAVADAVRAAVTAQVVTTPLEDSAARPEGPLAPLLDLTDVPADVRAALGIPPPVNAQPDLGMAEVLLALNRSGLDDEALSDAKRTIRRLAVKRSNLPPHA